MRNTFVVTVTATANNLNSQGKYAEAIDLSKGPGPSPRTSVRSTRTLLRNTATWLTSITGNYTAAEGHFTRPKSYAASCWESIRRRRLGTMDWHLTCAQGKYDLAQSAYFGRRSRMRRRVCRGAADSTAAYGEERSPYRFPRRSCTFGKSRPSQRCLNWGDGRGGRLPFVTPAAPATRDSAKSGFSPWSKCRSLGTRLRPPPTCQPEGSG